MPRQVDHDQRRHRVVEAVYALADEHGLEGVTLRDVARRAGLSMGAVQRSFRTKDEMLVLALTQVSEGFTDRARALAAEPSPAALARVAVDLALLDAEQRPDAQVWLAFVARAAVTPAMARILRDGYPQVHRLLAELIRGAAGPDVDAAHEARTLLALADGLTVQTLLGQLDRDRAREVLDAYLRRLGPRG
ncbi:TetR/AcrR family transcriptional regulator [Streptomyces sp. NPDC049906]|uniref:TetR/AcrR family transcriptional regulator n=1 Tax=Streptomyces sp. NPDC049906 TaxID=3155656 RepID=UPI003430DCE8